ncbi:MAG: aminomethyl-transferring glycine dehydrogenase [Flavobacteriales bacterium]|nr:aminomethyl-transferring glycine dehydrogenase [Flavobacteriales bacterium]
MEFVTFRERHIGPDEQATAVMLKTIGVTTLDELIDRTVPKGIRNGAGLELENGLTERELIEHMGVVGAQNQVYRSYIGLGYHGTVVPSVIQRNVLENPGWYTAYTPYQAEISQGRLEALLNFQTMAADLTGLPISNASLLDEATALAEAMHMLFAARPKEKADAKRFFVDRGLFPQNLDVLKTRSAPMGIELVEGDALSFQPDGSYFGIALQYPSMDGTVGDLKSVTARCKANGISVAVACDLLALVLLSPPGEWGADVCVGNSQRFGVPMGYGGPHAAFFTTTEEFKRVIPGRIIGVSQDRRGRPALRMALQTREQHIRRDKATSNICTAQALLAVMAGMYAVYHGPNGLRRIARRISEATARLAAAVAGIGYEVVNPSFFDTITLKLPEGIGPENVVNACASRRINLRPVNEKHVAVSLDETVREDDITDILTSLAEACGRPAPGIGPAAETSGIPRQLERTSPFLTHPVFNTHHSETGLMRYLKRLENRDFSLTHGMIPLGSCTMKLNAASTLLPLTWAEWANLHPFAPVEQAAGYHQVFSELSNALAKVTGFTGVSLQPNSGAQGEYAGLMVIRAYHEATNGSARNIALIPSSAHGTNPASAVMAGMKVVVVKCDEEGNVDIADLRAKAEQHRDSLSCLMVTYPSTHGVYESGIKEITSVVHEYGGLVYMDGANMNAQVGLTSPGEIGADVCHLNLHKTFAIPHGGGGPGMGPICVNDKLEPFLPGHPLVRTGGEQAIGAISAAPWGSALILLISHAYIKMLGADGLTSSTRMAILNANYIKSRLEPHYPVLYTGATGTVAHEMILDCRGFKRTAGIEVEDIAKRLMDYGFHAPTVSFPVAGTLMVEPTESEDLNELDRFCEAMIGIRQEIADIENGRLDKLDNPLKMAPHTVVETCAEVWSHPYSRELASFPTRHQQEWKYWPHVSRVDSAYGDRNLVCTCPPVEEYMEATV